MKPPLVFDTPWCRLVDQQLTAAYPYFMLDVTLIATTAELKAVPTIRTAPSSLMEMLRSRLSHAEVKRS